jgi:hypothetical protein
MSHGKVVVLQTPDQMKRNFGVGHTLLISNRDQNSKQELPKGEIKALIIDGDFVDGAQLAPMQDQHKVAYTIPFEESFRLSNLLSHLEKNYPDLLIDIETASLESAYLHIVEAEYIREKNAEA